MDSKKKGNVIKIIIAIIVIIAVVAVSIIAINHIIDNNQIQETEEKIRQINAEELEEKLIAELKNTPLNINTSTLKTTFGNQEKFAEEVDGFGLNMGIDFHYGKTNTDNPYEDCISAYISTNDGKSGIVIPCFKIVSDNNGNLQYILYATGFPYNVSEVVDKVFKRDYNIDKYLTGNTKYYEKFIKDGNQKYQEQIDIYVGLADEELTVTVVNEIVSGEFNYNLSNREALDWLKDNQSVTLAFFGIAN